MYSDRKKKKTGLPALLLAVLLLTAAVFYGFGGSGRDISEEGAAAIHETVRRAALQCCVVEGVYPPDLQYLQDNYGLQVNTDDYVVVYRAFADNRVPDIRVVKKEQ